MGEDGGCEGEDAADPQSPKQHTSPAKHVGEPAMRRGADQETDKPAGDQQSGLRGPQAPRRGDVVNNVCWVDQIIPIECRR